jgi:hypothetical protein
MADLAARHAAARSPFVCGIPVDTKGPECGVESPRPEPSGGSVEPRVTGIAQAPIISGRVPYQIGGTKMQQGGSIQVGIVVQDLAPMVDFYEGCSVLNILKTLRCQTA